MCIFFYIQIYDLFCPNTVELEWLEQRWAYENMLKRGVVRAKEC